MTSKEILSITQNYDIGKYNNLNTLTANTVIHNYLKFGITSSSNVTITYPEDLTNDGYALVLPNRSGVSGEFLGIDNNNKLKWCNPNVTNNVHFKYSHGLNSSLITIPYTAKTLIIPDNYEITLKPSSTTSKLLIQFRVAYQASFSSDTAITFELWKRIGNDHSNDIMIQSEADLGPLNATGTNKSQYIISSVIESGTTEEITIYLGFKFNNLNVCNDDTLPAGINVGILGYDKGYNNSLIVTDFEGSGAYSTLLSKSHDNESIYYNLGTLFLGSNYNSLNTNNTSSLSLKTQEGISAPLFIGHFQGNVTGNYVITDNITCLNLTANVIDTNILNGNIITTDELYSNIFTTNTLTSNILTSNMITTYDISINNSLKTKDLDVFGNLHVHGSQTIVNSEILNVLGNININDNYILDVSAIKFSNGSFFNSNILNENIESINSKIATLQTEMNAVEGNITILQDNIISLEGNIINLQNQMEESYTSNSNAIFTNDIIVRGNLYVLGTQTIMNSTIVEIDDNIIIVNADGELLKEAGLSANIGGNNYNFVFDICSNSWTTQNNNLSTNKLSANIIELSDNIRAPLFKGNLSGTDASLLNNVTASWFNGNLSGTTGKLNNLNMFGNINLNNNNWINDVSGILFADGTILTSNQISSIGGSGGTGSIVDLNNYTDVSFGNMDIIGSSKFKVNGTATKEFQVGCQYRFDKDGEFLGLVFFKNGFVIEAGRPEFNAGLTITSQIMELKQQASIGIHTSIPQKPLDVNSESVFRDTITAKNKINLTGNLSIEKSITYNWNNLGQDLSGDLSNDRFGSSVAINNIGNIIAVGANLSNINGTHSGLVRIYENIDNSWNQIGQDLSGIIHDEQFGFSLSINDIGNIIAVGTPFSNINGSLSGAVRIYNYNGSSWQQIGNDLSGVAEDGFGYSLSINSIGNIVAIGAPFSDINGANSGVVRIYQNISNSWSQIGEDLSGKTTGEFFGFSLSIDGTGDIIAIGSPFYSSGNYQNDGRVIIYNFNGSIWQQKGNNYITGDGNGDKSGHSVSLSKDGKRVAIGAPYNDGNGNDSGNVSIYDFDSIWWVKLGNSINGDSYTGNNGWSVSLNNDGSRVIMGEPNTISGAPIGMIKVYEYDSVTNLDWLELGKKIYGKMAEDKFGYSVGMNGIGDKIIVGTPLCNISHKGEVNIYELESIYNNSNIDVSGGATFSSDVTILGNLTVNGTFTNSDKRLKENNIDIINGIELIKKLKPQIYDKRNKLELEDNNYYIKESGFIAQDIEEVEELKHLINKPKNIEKEPYTMNYIGLIAYNTAATKELNNIVEQQKIKINSQENRIQQLENKVLLQETLINQLISRIEALENS